MGLECRRCPYVRLSRDEADNVSLEDRQGMPESQDKAGKNAELDVISIPLDGGSGIQTMVVSVASKIPEKKKIV